MAEKITNVVIDRRLGESFYVGDDVRVTLVRIKGGSAKITVQAPRNVHVVREEKRLNVINRNKPKSGNT